MSKFLEFFSKSNTDLSKAVAALAKSVGSIVKADDTQSHALAETFEQFNEHLKQSGGEMLPTDKEGTPAMSEKLIKALGLKDGASEDDMLKALAERDLNLAIAKANMSDDEKDHHDSLKSDDEREKFRNMGAQDRKASMNKNADVPEHIRKQLDRMEQMEKTISDMRKNAELAAFEKRAAEMNMPKEFGAVLAKAYAGGDKAALDEIIGKLKAANMLAAEAGAFKEFGTSHGGNGGDATAYDELMTKAREYRKVHPELSEAQAFSKVFEDPANVTLAKRERLESNSAIPILRPVR